MLGNILNPPARSASTAGGFGITISIITQGGDKSDVRSVVRAHLSALRTEVRSAANLIADPMSKYHLQDIVDRIDNALNPKE